MGLKACRYTLAVHTSDCKGAGTDANVFCRLHGRNPAGDNASTALIQLASSANDFERNHKDTFVVTGQELAHIDSLDIGHDGAGLFADWHLQYVEIANPAGGLSGTLRHLRVVSFDLQGMHALCACICINYLEPFSHGVAWSIRTYR